MINLYRDRPDLYDLLHDDQGADLDFYAAFAERCLPDNGTILELGCGSGRVMEVLLEQGPCVTGLDAEAAMLQRARERLARFGERAQYLRADMCAFECEPERFDVILVAANTFMHLESHQRQSSCLGAIRAALNPGGVAVLDLANPFHVMALPQGIVTLRRQADHEHGEREMMVTGVLEVDPTTPRLLDRLYFDEWGADGRVQRLTSLIELRLVFMPELELLLASAGLGITDAYGDYELEPYHKDAERMIVVIRPYDE